MSFSTLCHLPLDRSICENNRSRICVPCHYSCPGACECCARPFLFNTVATINFVYIVFAGLFAYVTTFVVSFAIFLVLLMIDPTTLVGCLIFWCNYLLVHLTCYAIHSWTPRVSMILVLGKPWRDIIPSSLVQEVVDQLF